MLITLRERRVTIAKKKAEQQEQLTIWEIPDDIWPMIQEILYAHYPAKPKGHRRVDLRLVLNGIIFRLRTGCQWNQLPKPLATTAPCTGTSSAGANAVSWRAFRPCWSRPLISLTGMTGNGKPAIAPWAKPAWEATW
jgi:transposase